MLSEELSTDMASYLADVLALLPLSDQLLTCRTGSLNFKMRYLTCVRRRAVADGIQAEVRVLQSTADPQLLTLSHTSIDYITKRTQFEQTSHAILTTLISNKAAPKAEYQSE